ncbi:heparinase II/III family protein [Aquamicrobium sp. LC103]|uniref:heparinase II/III family protein n=1 Tax=Aquamicrobium sp. LC103 TaxID=1120658 RepID=UPI00063E9782|nr:heparinase II/III family protein [Aquamicrobium sp. LC103]TKT82961.1 heparinase [Aquamicrobium sp. LC103]
MTIARGDAPQLCILVASEIWRRVRRRLRAGPIYRWRFTGRTPERVLIAPPDLRLADPQIAHEIYHGRFPLGGFTVDTVGASPFQTDVANPAWQRSLHGFRWLRHMRAAGTDLASANARALVSDWISIYGRRISGVAWEPAVTARRIISWLQHSAVVLQGAEFPFYRAFLKSLTLQIRYLRAVAAEMPDGEERLRARIALAFAALSLPVPSSAIRSASKHLSAELERQIFPDGGHVSRNPEAVLELLADLLPLRQTYSNQAEAPPEALIGAVERMLPALRFFRHQDGTLARFNGMGATSHDRIAAILHHDDTAGAPLLHAPHSGYERLAMGTTTVIADAGAPPPTELSHQAQAGCLSFELSSGRHHFVVNCGVDTYGAEDFRPLARSTAAHSTATVNDTSSGRFVLSPRLTRLLGTPLINGPRRVRCERTDGDGTQGFVASHDAYVPRFGLYHQRELSLSAEGKLVEGIDRFFRSSGDTARANGRDAVQVRFHLHPHIELFEDRHQRLILSARDGDGWVFSCQELLPAVEESLFFAGLGGPRRSSQIVLSFKASEHPEIHWRIQKL